MTEFLPPGNLNDQNEPSVNSDYGQDCSPLYPLRYIIPGASPYIYNDGLCCVL